MKYIACLLLFIASALPLGAQAADPIEPTITVNAQGAVLRSPDDAVVYATLTTTNDSATTAMGANNTAYDNLQRKLTALGIAEANIKTQSLNVNFVPRPQPGNATPQPYYGQRFGYTVTRSLAIDAGTRELAAKAIDAATAAEASNISVRFMLKNQRDAYMSALTAAVKDAQAQASAIAAAAGVRIIGLRSVQVGSSYTPQPMAMMRSAAMPAPAQPTDLSTPGDIEIRANVTATYTIAR